MSADPLITSAAALLGQHQDFEIISQREDFLTFVHLRRGEAVGLSAMQLERGWLTLLAPAISYAQGLDADMIGQIFAMSWTLGPLRFVLADDGLYLRADLPAPQGDLDPTRLLRLAAHLGGAVHRLLDHQPAWMAFEDRTPLSLPQLQALLTQAQIEHEFLPKRDLIRLIHDEDNLFNPTALELDAARGVVRLIYGLSAVEQPAPAMLSPTAAANLLRANDQLQLARLAYSPEQGGIMLLQELPTSWIDASTLRAAFARLRLDILRLERTFSGLTAALEPIFERLLTQQRAAQLDDALIAQTLRLIAQGQPMPHVMEAHDDLLDATLELADVMFRLLPKQQPRALAILPLQLDLVEQGAAPLHDLLTFVRDYASAPPMLDEEHDADDLDADRSDEDAEITTHEPQA